MRDHSLALIRGRHIDRLYHLTRHCYLSGITREGLRTNIAMSGMTGGHSDFSCVMHKSEKIRPIYFYEKPGTLVPMIYLRWVIENKCAVLEVDVSGYDLYDPGRGYRGEIVCLHDIPPDRITVSKSALSALKTRLRQYEDTLSRG